MVNWDGNGFFTAKLVGRLPVYITDLIHISIEYLMSVRIACVSAVNIDVCSGSWCDVIGLRSWLTTA